MKNIEIISIATLIEETDICLDMLVSFDLIEELEIDSVVELFPVVHVKTKSYNEHIGLDDIYYHNISGNMFMYYETFISCYCAAKGMAYAGAFKALYDETGTLFALALSLN